jgi:hypothetical protein
MAAAPACKNLLSELTMVADMPPQDGLLSAQVPVDELTVEMERISVRAKVVQKPCGVCSKQGHHRRNCAVYFKQIHDEFPKWAFPLINHERPMFMYMAQACIMLTGDRQSVAMGIWDCITLGHTLTPQVLMELVRQWEHICSVAQNLGYTNYKDNRDHFLTKRGCWYWMNTVSAVMHAWQDVSFERVEMWYLFCKDAIKVFIAETTSSDEARWATHAIMVMPRCSKCTDLGHRSNHCPKFDE